MDMKEERDYSYKKSRAKASKKSSGIGGFFKSIGRSIAGVFTKKKSDSKSKSNNIKNEVKDELGASPDNYEIGEGNISNENEIKISNEKNINKENKDKKELNIKDIINEQNFVEGYWEITENTKKIKEKYKSFKYY